MDLKHSNANSNHSKGIRTIQMQIRSITKGIEAFKSTLETLERDSNHSNVNSNHSKGMWSIQIKFSNHLKGIRSIQMQILTIRKGFEVFKCKFEPFEC